MAAININHEHQLLQAIINAVTACDERETALLHDLKELREKRAELDASVQRIVVECEEARLAGGDYRTLFSGIRHQVAVSLTRHSFRGVTG